MHPKNDSHFEDVEIKEVTKTQNGWDIKREDGWSFFGPGDSPVEPVVGMMARFYGKGVGFSVRGLFLDGVRVYYRTEAEEEEKRQIDLFGIDCADWLKRWDEGRTVWSIEMGGLGPGYEQAIQITVAEILRFMLAEKYDFKKWNDQDTWKRDREEIRKAGFKNPIIEQLGLSGAQWGAAVNVASSLYMRGPRAVMSDERTKDRQIQVQRTFPVPA